jgi:hypothetical protein
VRRQAAFRCEYCLLHQEQSPVPHHIEHIVARKHGGSEDLDNLALPCHRRNFRKGPNLTGIDPESGKIVSLFDPRRDGWGAHFRLTGTRVEGLTAIGRTTVRVLAMNDPRRLELRRAV